MSKLKGDDFSSLTGMKNSVNEKPLKCWAKRFDKGRANNIIGTSNSVSFKSIRFHLKRFEKYVESLCQENAKIKHIHFQRNSYFQSDGF